MWAFGVDDGSAIVLANRQMEGSTSPKPERDLLSSAPIEVANWLTDAVAAGITFDVLKAIAAQAIRRGWARRDKPVDASTVTATVLGYLLSSGYLDPQVSEIRHVPEQGWTAKGSADGRAFTARSDESGNVVHVRVR